jgi:hypothetical protein
MKMMEQHPNMVDMLKLYCMKWKQQKESEFQKLTQNKHVYNELNPNLEPKVNDVQLHYNFRYSTRFDILTQKRYKWDLIIAEIENQSKRYPINPKINMWCN